MKKLLVTPGKLSGSITAPPSKSHTMRALLFASMAKGCSIIRNALVSPDVDAMMIACKNLGAKITHHGTHLEIQGVAGKPKTPDDVINAGNSGQVLRFIAGIAALAEGYTVITGDHSVRFNRPVRPLIDGLTGLGAQCYSSKLDDHAPLIIKGPLQAGMTSLDGEDSQPVSALLIAAAFLQGTTHLTVKNPGETPWVNLTLRWLERVGVAYTQDNFENYSITGKPVIDAFDYTVPGDFSSIAYPLVAALITKSAISIANIDMQDAQGDKKIIDSLRKMGAEIHILDRSLIVHPCEKLHGMQFDMNDYIDAVTILAVVGCFAEGTTTLTNAAIARKKESDRLSTITTELKKMGADITETQDSLIINRSKLSGADCYSYQDHRIAMSCAVAALAAENNSVIQDIDCINKSYTDFVRDITYLGGKIEVVA